MWRSSSFQKAGSTIGTVCTLAQEIGPAVVEDEPGGLCGSADLLRSLCGGVLRPSAPRQRVPCLCARGPIDAELCAGHGRKAPPARLHLGSLFDSRRGRRREARSLAGRDFWLHPRSAVKGRARAEAERPFLRVVVPLPAAREPRRRRQLPWQPSPAIWQRSARIARNPARSRATSPLPTP